jgi:hypothetical protein
MALYTECLDSRVFGMHTRSILSDHIHIISYHIYERDIDAFSTTTTLNMYKYEYGEV